MKLGIELGFKVFGVDLSHNAVESTKAWLAQEFATDKFDPKRIIAGPSAMDAFKDFKFNVILAASCLDSMYFSVAMEFVAKFRKLMAPEGIFIFDVISGDETGRSRDFVGDLVVDSEIEKGTIQSYYNQKKIEDLLQSQFKIVESVLLRVEDNMMDSYSGRHFIACVPV